MSDVHEEAEGYLLAAFDDVEEAAISVGSAVVGAERPIRPRASLEASRGNGKGLGCGRMKRVGEEEVGRSDGEGEM